MTVKTYNQARKIIASCSGCDCNLCVEQVATAIKNERDELTARVKELERKLSFRNQCWQEEMLRAEKAEEALKPFAAQADAYDPLEGDDDHPLWGPHKITIGEVRRARSVLKAGSTLSTLHQVRAQNEAWKASLKPFAEEAERLRNYPDDYPYSLHTTPITVGHLRALRALLTEGEATND